MSRLWLPSNEVIVPQRRSRRPAPGMLAAMGHVGGCCCVSTPEPCTDESFWAFWESVTAIEFTARYYIERGHMSCLDVFTIDENDIHTLSETAPLIASSSSQRTYRYSFTDNAGSLNCCGDNEAKEINICRLDILRSSKSMSINKFIVS